MAIIVWSIIFSAVSHEILKQMITYVQVHLSGWKMKMDILVQDFSGGDEAGAIMEPRYVTKSPSFCLHSNVKYRDLALAGSVHSNVSI